MRRLLIGAAVLAAFLSGTVIAGAGGETVEHIVVQPGDGWQALANRCGTTLATVNLTGVPGSSSSGPIVTVAQPATLTLTAVPGSSSVGGVSTTGMPALLTITGIAGVSVPGAVTSTAQPATLTLTAVPGVSGGGARFEIVSITGPVITGPSATLAMSGPSGVLAVAGPSAVLEVS